MPYLGTILPALALLLVSCAPSATLSSPTTTATAATPSASVSATAASERFGLIVGTRLTGETDASTLATLPAAVGRVVSPDGRSVAYWEGESSASRVLSVFETATMRAHVVLTLPDTELAANSTGAGVVWSTDGRGLLFAVNSRDHAGTPPPAEVPFLYTALRTVDLSSGTIGEVARRDRTSLFYAPLVWDRARGRVGAVEVGLGGGFATGQVLFRDDHAPLRTPLAASTLPRLVVATRDGTRVLMWGFFIDGPSGLFVWDTESPDAPKRLASSPGETIVGALWRDDDNVAVSLRTTATGLNGDRLEVWGLDGSRRVVYRGEHTLSSLRPDGTAAITSAGILDLDSGAIVKRDGLSGAVSVRLR